MHGQENGGERKETKVQDGLVNCVGTIPWVVDPALYKKS